MRYQELMIDATRKASEEAFRYARAVPEDKLTWIPMGDARSVLDQCRELAMTPTWAAEIIGGATPEWSEEKATQIKTEQEQWNTVQSCQDEFNKRFEEYANVLKNFPDERLLEKKWLPFEGGREFTFMEMMDYPRWNLNYHVGQIAYVQLMLGDKEMH